MICNENRDGLGTLIALLRLRLRVPSALRFAESAVLAGSCGEKTGISCDNHQIGPYFL